MNNETKPAKINFHRNDICWSYWDDTDGEIRWWGYNDSYWWERVSPSEQFRVQKCASGKLYTLDPRASTVTIFRPDDVPKSTEDEAEEFIEENQ